MQSDLLKELVWYKLTARFNKTSLKAEHQDDSFMQIFMLNVKWGENSEDLQDCMYKAWL